MPLFFDSYYMILVLPAILLAFIAQGTVNTRFRKYAQIQTGRGLTGAQAAEAGLRQNGVYGVRIEPVRGNLTDHYDPRENVIRLSEPVYGGASVSAAGIAAHEAGHAVQHAQGYQPIRLRQAIIPVTQVGSQLAMPLVLIGLLLGGAGRYGQIGQTVFLVGILFFMLATVFQLITLPVEFNASRRAISALQDAHVLTMDELPGAKKVLSAAAMTYVAALAVSLAQILRLLLLFSGGRRSRR